MTLGYTFDRIRAFYGLSSLPYIVFKVPIVKSLLIHTDKMGYDRLGHTVAIQHKKKIELSPPPKN